MELNNAEKIKIWLGIRIPGLPDPPTPTTDHFRFYEVVSEHFIPNSYAWNVELLDKLFDANTSMKIQTLFIDPSKEDVMLWIPAKDEKFFVKSTYNMLTKCNRVIQINGSDIKPPLWKRLWNCKAAHRVKLFAWKSIRDLHTTKTKLASYNNEQDIWCSVCGQYEETIEHLLFECRHARAIWRGVNINIDSVKENSRSVS